MNEKAIKRLRRKIILTVMLSLFLVMVFMGVTINAVSFASSHRVINRVLDNIANNDGEVTMTAIALEDDHNDNYFSIDFFDFGFIARVFDPDFTNYARYFVAYFDDEGNITQFKTVYDSMFRAEEMAALGEKAYNRLLNYGRIGTYYYKLTDNKFGEGKIAVFLDCSRELASIYRLMYLTMIICVVGLVLTFIISVFFSKSLIAPEVENTRRQREFITNAGHELKTPLAVIKANTELIEMMGESNEWTQSTLKQVDHMDGLIKNLVMISRAEEKADKSGLVNVNVSDAVKEACGNFEAVAKADGKTLKSEIEADVHMMIEEGRMRQLAGLLLDNAMKYCDDGGTVSVVLSTLRKGRTVRLTVSNSFAGGAGIDYNRFFERFYRADESHKQEKDKSGYGIGLSMAESICKQYGGNIKAYWKDGVISFTCVLSSGL